MGARWEWYLPPGDEFDSNHLYSESLGDVAPGYHSPVRVEEENGRASTAGRSTARESEYAHLLSKRILDEAAAMESAELD